eukprot:GILJ01005508.1.p1 GENE.GILJ01005508.1~~GILJ01005508.1.p1  ORF type:complete len:414 (+),score=43.51 GILJ01005508.1:146-1243(+)
MKAAVLTAPNKALSIERIPIPMPKSGEVLIKVKACGVCHTDLHVMKSEVAFPTPCVLGHEITGEVISTGAGVHHLPVGQRVVSAFIMPCGYCPHCVRGNDDLCEQFFAQNRGKGTLYDGTSRLARSNGDTLAMYSMGGLAEYCIVPSTDVAVLPNEVPYEEASILGCAVFTAYGAVKHAGNVRVGDSVAVVGAGGVGTNVLQIARLFGAGPIIAIDINDDKLAACKALGATHTINAMTENVNSRVAAITGNRGIDIAFEALGKPQTFETCVALVKDGGKAVMVGIAPAGQTAQIDITRLVRRQIKIIGSYGAKTRQDLPDIVELTRAGKIDVVQPISRRFTLDQAQEAYSALDRGEIVGRAIVTM